jgi:hypothetical protein
MGTNERRLTNLVRGRDRDCKRVDFGLSPVSPTCLGAPRQALAVIVSLSLPGPLSWPRRICGRPQGWPEATP